MEQGQFIANKNKFASGRYFACVVFSVGATTVAIIATIGAVFLDVTGAMNVLNMFFIQVGIVVGFYFGNKSRPNENPLKKEGNQ